MSVAKVVLLCVQCFNLGMLFMLGIFMLINEISYRKRQKEYEAKNAEFSKRYEELQKARLIKQQEIEKKYQEIMEGFNGKTKKSNEE